MRIAALDGLRGFAAFVVLLHHTFECLGGTIPSVIQGTLLVAAQQAVWLFFVLSGAVLTLQVQKQGFAAAYYLPSRLARLYLPTAAAVILAYGSILLVNRAIPTGNLWVDMHPQFLHLNALMSDLTLINGTSGNLMPLWSLKW